MALQSNTRIGPYEVIGQIGAGGMGEVYRAVDTNLGRQVAVKVLPETFANDPERLARFEREAKTLASLNHPNIAQIYGLEKADGIRALVMELVEGPTLADRIAQGPMPVDEALPIARQIAEALEAAHEQNIIHRDLKPANIKLRPDGTVKVLDFGLAKALEPASSAGVDATASPTITSPAMMTGVGVLLGTAAYMSPEQARGKAVDKRSDIWAFGCVLFEMLAGLRAFGGEDVTDTLAGVVRSEPQWNVLSDAIPRWVRQLLRQCLVKDPRQRVSDISIALYVIRAEVSSERSLEAIPATLAQAPRRQLAVPVAVGFVVAALTSAAWWTLRPPVPSPVVTRSTMNLSASERFTDLGLRAIAISPDGTKVAYVANRQLYLRSMSERTARPIPGTEATEALFGSPVFSPDGQFIAFYEGSLTGGGALKRIAIGGGTAMTIRRTEFFIFLSSWGDEGIVFSEIFNGIMRVPPNGGQPDVLVRLDGREVALGATLLPGGRTVLFTLGAFESSLRTLARSNVRIVAQSLATGERKTLVEGGSDARYLSTGHLAYVASGVLYAVPFDIDILEVTGSPTPLVEGISQAVTVGVNGSSHLNVSQTGSLIYISGPTASVFASTLISLDRSGTTMPLGLVAGSYFWPRVSPDGSQVAYYTDDGKEANLWTYALSRAQSPRQLTFQGRNRFPVWSRDGRHIAFQSDRDGDLGIYRQASDGSTSTERLTRAEKGVAHNPESWSRDGNHILFTVDEESVDSLWVFSFETRKAAPFGDVKTSSRLISPEFSPDGRWIAYSETTRNTSRVFVQPFPATGAKHLVSEGARPQWSPSGKELYFLDGGGTSVVSVSTNPTFTVGKPDKLSFNVYAGLGGGFGRNVDIMPDGRHFVAAIPARTEDTEISGAREIQVVQGWFEELKRLVPTN